MGVTGENFRVMASNQSADVGSCEPRDWGVGRLEGAGAHPHTSSGPRPARSPRGRCTTAPRCCGCSRGSSRHCSPRSCSQSPSQSLRQDPPPGTWGRVQGDTGHRARSSPTQQPAWGPQAHSAGKQAARGSWARGHWKPLPSCPPRDRPHPPHPSLPLMDKEVLALGQSKRAARGGLGATLGPPDTSTPWGAHVHRPPSTHCSTAGHRPPARSL